jgi:hypothetical protein
MAYSPFFEVLHDELTPVGNIGRGTHYSILRTLVAVPPIGKGPILPPMQQHTFALIWDEDHDERVIRVLEQLHVAHLLAPIRFIGERKGTLNVLYDPATAIQWTGAKDCIAFEDAIEKIADHNEDAWGANVFPLGSRENYTCLVQSSEKVVGVYVDNITNLWPLGLSPWKQAPLPEAT